jgi:exoribonuclease-2
MPFDLHAIARRAMMERGLQPDYSPEALRQVQKIDGPARDDDQSIRDLRGLPWCSIDNDDSRDLDQLTAAESMNGGIRIMVAIADVDGLVKRGTAVDSHARHNTTSVYTEGGIFAMLPERLSTDLTSLNPDQERQAVVVSYVVLSDGSLDKREVFRALVHNKAKLAYNSVSAWLDGSGPQPEAMTEVIAEQIHIQDEATARLKKRRAEIGALNLETIEPYAVKENGRIVDMVQVEKNRAREIIEDIMIAANEVTARCLTEQAYPTLRRVVRSPERWDRLEALAETYGDSLPHDPDPKALEAFLERRKEADPLRFPDLSLTVIKLMGAGEYVVNLPGEEPVGHFGLAVRDYSHSTAPNRRYPDLITQRLLKGALAGRPVPFSTDELHELALHCTEQEDAAKKVERHVRKSAAALMLHDRIGQKFDALVTGASDKGTWARVLNPPVEGRVVQRFKGLDVGDRIRVQLVAVNVERGFIDFARD